MWNENFIKFTNENEMIIEFLLEIGERKCNKSSIWEIQKVE